MRTRRTLIRSLATAIVLVTGCAPAAPPASPPAPTTTGKPPSTAPDKPASTAAAKPAPTTAPVKAAKVRVVSGGLIAARIPFYLAFQKGFLKDEALDIELVAMASGADSAKVLASGTVDMFVGQFVDGVNINKAGVNVLGFAMLTNKISNNIVVRKDFAGKVKSMADVRGPEYVIGVPSIGSGSWQFVVYNAQLAGVPKEQLNFVVVATAASSTSMKSGRINIGSYPDPEAYRMVSDGDAEYLVDMTKEDLHNRVIGKEYLNNQVMATTAYIKANPDVVQRFTNAIQRALNWTRDSSPEQIAEVLNSYPGFETMDRQLLVATLQRMGNAIPKTAVITREAFESATKLPLATGGMESPMPFEQLVTNEFAEKAAQKFPPS